MHRFLIFALFALSLPASAQFRTIEIQFEGIGCASCIESLPSRIQRMRGVTSATIDAQKQILKVELAEANRVRVEQIRDAIEQDGTKTVKASVTVRGELAEKDGKWVLRLPGVPATYEVSSATPPTAGTHVITGGIDKLRPDSGPLVVVATAIE
jgi:copper chaperone CopZ